MNVGILGSWNCLCLSVGHGTHSACSRVCQRKFIPTCLGIPDESKEHQFRALSYNILANSYAYDPSHMHCPRNFLWWDYRKQRILEELDGYNADIICLQELEKSAFLDDFEPKYSAAGYEALYCQKVPVVPQGFDEGVATFFKTSLFERIASHSDIFSNQFQKAGTGQFFRAVRSRADCFSMALLKHKPSGKHLLACNVHLYWHPKWPDVKVTQMHVLLECIKSFLERQALPQESSILIMGDFNSMIQKTEQDRYDKIKGRSLVSGVHDLLINGRVDDAHPHHPFNRNHTGRLANGRVRISEVLFESNGLLFDGAYSLAVGREPLVTTCTSDFKHCVDYIYLSRGDFHVSEILEMPYDTKGIREAKHVKFMRIPNARFPSDHLAVGATLRLRNAVD